MRARTGGIGASLLLIAAGAIMAWAVTTEVEGFNINTAGVILLVIGIIGLVLSLFAAYTADSRSEDTHTTGVDRE